MKEIKETLSNKIDYNCLTDIQRTCYNRTSIILDAKILGNLFTIFELQIAKTLDNLLK